jgi:hypothetical protein
MTSQISKEFKFIDTYYRVTKYFGSNLIEISELVPNGFWGKSSMVYKRIYMGHANPLSEALDFFEETPTPINEDNLK